MNTQELPSSTVTNELPHYAYEASPPATLQTEGESRVISRWHVDLSGRGTFFPTETGPVLSGPFLISPPGFSRKLAWC